MKFDINKIKVDLQYLLPKWLLTVFAGLLAKHKLGKLTTFMIQEFANFYKINTDEMEKNLTEYETFNDFFARALKDGARPICKEKNSLCFPADGTISQLGSIKDEFMIQAKNHYYTTEALLGNKDDGKTFKNGDFITIYLSPKDYHRVHIPFTGKLEKMTYVPGELFSVNQLNAENIPELFARNERAVCIFDTEIGKMAVVFVGATIVRSITTQWEGVVAPNKSSEITTYDYSDKNISFEKGDEIGKFTLGSTVICLFEKNKIDFDKSLQPQDKVKVGQLMATSK